MLRNTKDLAHYVIDATDGTIGHVRDFYFDDDAWVVRYLVVETGLWLVGRKVLISPIAVHDPNWLERTLPVSMTRQQVKDSPNIDTDKPVSRQNEEQYSGYYTYPYYWAGAGLWGDGLYPYAMFPGYVGLGDSGANREERERDDVARLHAERIRHRNDDPHLRSCHAVTGYKIRATDGELGTVAGCLVDDETWAIGYLIVQTGHWWADHQVLIAPQWISGLEWSDKSVSVDMTLAQVRQAPAFDPDVAWSRELDSGLHQHYGRTGPWAGHTGRWAER